MSTRSMAKSICVLAVSIIALMRLSRLTTYLIGHFLAVPIRCSLESSAVSFCLGLYLVASIDAQVYCTLHFILCCPIDLGANSSTILRSNNVVLAIDRRMIGIQELRLQRDMYSLEPDYSSNPCLTVWSFCKANSCVDHFAGLKSHTSSGREER